MRLALLFNQYRDALEKRYTLTPMMRRTIDAMNRCRTQSRYISYWQCGHCHHEAGFPLSCGNRHCPQCQHHTTQQWLHIQQMKLLPVSYFMLTFTLPAQLRALTKAHDKAIYTAMFTLVNQLLLDFAKRHKQLNGQIGFTVVLHTHSRQLQYHPHLHVVIPAGCFNSQTNQWHQAKGDYLFNVKALSKVWRARMLEYLNHQLNLTLPNTPMDWVVNCQAVGQGEPALKYLSRYLYRGVIQEKNILNVEHDLLTFQYQDSQTKQMTSQTLPVLSFLWRVLQHILPKGFRRTRQYGLLAGANRLKLRRIQLLLKVIMLPFIKPKTATRPCPRCQHDMHFIDLLPAPDS